VRVENVHLPITWKNKAHIFRATGILVVGCDNLNRWRLNIAVGSHFGDRVTVGHG
jgi:hypothetical protein